MQYMITNTKKDSTNAAIIAQIAALFDIRSGGKERTGNGISDTLTLWTLLIKASKACCASTRIPSKSLIHLEFRLLFLWSAVYYLPGRMC